MATLITLFASHCLRASAACVIAIAAPRAPAQTENLPVSMIQTFCRLQALHECKLFSEIQPIEETELCHCKLANIQDVVASLIPELAKFPWAKLNCQL